jgi:hypothetical protein
MHGSYRSDHLAPQQAEAEFLPRITISENAHSTRYVWHVAYNSSAYPPHIMYPSQLTAMRLPTVGPRLQSAMKRNYVRSFATTLSQDERPLAGVKVVDMTRVLAGPLATMMLVSVPSWRLRMESRIGNGPLLIWILG